MKFRRIVLIINKLLILLRILFLLCLIAIIALSLYFLYDNKHIEMYADNKYYAEYKPENENIVSFEELKHCNKDVISWICIEETSIDYPVVQGMDNVKYLNTNPLGEYETSGSIFLDCTNRKDFSDEVNIIYGHHMSNELMFGELDRYDEYNFFKEHLKGKLFINNKYHSLNVFAYIKDVDGYDSNIYFIDNKQSKENTIKELLCLAKYKVSSDNISKGNILLLSTCSHGRTNGRNILACVISGLSEEDNNIIEESVHEQIKTPTWLYILFALLCILLTLILMYRRIYYKRRNWFPPYFNSIFNVALLFWKLRVPREPLIIVIAGLVWPISAPHVKGIPSSADLSKST